jgi:hypothetical protein
MNIILTENQLNIIKKLVSEEESNNRYRRNIKVNLNHFNLTYKGNEINDIIVIGDIDVSYIIELDQRSWGIKDISLYNITGPNTIQLEVSYYIDDDNTNDEIIELPINWEEIDMEYMYNESIVTVGDTLNVELDNDNKGNLMIKSMSIDVYTL